ncbi:N-formylglutamate deformylase [Pseudoduganella umbonata]|uniref:N-formylglutamate deformylase n=1 Tax=Pseudoduganella umbonata TaxID=864828 RepID=A0A4P8HT82_9BURK|nr:N-formylglutamate deformylase [Pseudoduganella umbonata]MBB3220573.1 N-formylglutamate deformylase [Pseudoduganella umbonata]QCP11922.1 N-formylglutamate deformylase [Pseudoduganella umbonata]
MDFHFEAGTLPLLVSMPHVGTAIPDDIAAAMTPAALPKADTDWHLRELYGFARDIGASTLAAHWSRYVIDLNRPADNTNLYPGQDTTGLCPLDTFGREPLYQPGRAPDDAEVRRRLALYWQPYHERLRAELGRLLDRHGRVVLWEAHSIASVVPRFFEGKLPDLNFGSADGASCDPALMDVVTAAARADGRYTIAVNGRFKGGHITRTHGRPGVGIHALQLEMCQSTYMDETAPFGYRPDLAAQVQPLLRRMLEAAAGWAGERGAA